MSCPSLELVNSRTFSNYIYLTILNITPTCQSSPESLKGRRPLASSKKTFIMAKILYLPILLVLVWLGQTKGITLHRINVRRDLVTVSGFSSGGTMAQQMFVSYSSLFKGFSTISHAFYRCGFANGNSTSYDHFCTNQHDSRISEMYPASRSIVDIYNYYSLGLIEDPRNMADKPMYIFAGSSNPTFNMHHQLSAVPVFQPFINNNERIKIRIQAANLTLPTDRRGLPECTAAAAPLLVSNCGFSAAFEGLQWILGANYVRPATPGIKLQPLLEFDQTEFFRGFADNVVQGPYMDSVGFLYIPKPCRKYGKQCLLHVYFHGCRVGRELVGPNHILNSGYLELAETNGIIMLFPQAIGNPQLNPSACWDTFGYTSGEFYATQVGAQVTVIKNMLDRLLGSPPSDDSYYGSNPEPYSYTPSTTTTTPQPAYYNSPPSDYGYSPQSPYNSPSPPAADNYGYAPQSPYNSPSPPPSDNYGYSPQSPYNSPPASDNYPYSPQSPYNSPPASDNYGYDGYNGYNDVAGRNYADTVPEDSPSAAISPQQQQRQSPRPTYFDNIKPQQCISRRISPDTVLKRCLY